MYGETHQVATTFNSMNSTRTLIIHKPYLYKDTSDTIVSSLFREMGMYSIIPARWCTLMYWVIVPHLHRPASVAEAPSLGKWLQRQVQEERPVQQSDRSPDPAASDQSVAVWSGSRWYKNALECQHPLACKKNRWKDRVTQNQHYVCTAARFSNLDQSNRIFSRKVETHT